MTNEIYFDNSATTCLSSEAKAAMTNVIENIYGNPSSLHSVGLKAEKVISEARNDVLLSLGVRGDVRRLIFCGSGSEANNLALTGVFTSKRRHSGSSIITTSGEHSSIEAAASHLEALGAKVIRLSTKNGKIDFDEFANSLSQDTAIVSIMLVNNETGAIYPVGELFKLAKAKYPDIICHCDAVQGYGKLKFTPKNLCADLITVSAHKIHGPKGVAALYVSPEVLKRRALVPIIHGGQQENGLRAGTENTVCIAGFGAAAKASAAMLRENAASVNSLSEHIENRILSDMRLKEIRINRPENKLPHIINITLPNIKSETMLHFLSGKDIFVSSGSACSSHAKVQSRALGAFGLTENESDCSLRISLSKYNTKDEADMLCEALATGLEQLIRIKA